MIRLFESKKGCCGCGACMNICPRQAITMKRDEDGFLYPNVDKNKCIECRACINVCGYQKGTSLNLPSKVYAAASKNTSLILKSASGGVFSTIAKFIIEHGGVVFGASMKRESTKFVIKHKYVETLKDLTSLLGSKYVQSEIGTSYKDVKSFLLQGKRVLFSGTPCQCAGLRSFLRKSYDNLIVIDIICHGVPNQKFFNDYINYNYGTLNGIKDFKFRDKTKGWEMTACLDYEDGHKLIPGRTSSYFTLFLDGHIYRENCYSCKYAQKERVGDLTIGDFWGVQKEHPEIIDGKNITTRKGISCILVNTSVGENLIEEVSTYFELRESTFEKVAIRNEQLKFPSKESIYRSIIFKIYGKDGYGAVEKWYQQTFRQQIIIQRIFNFMPRFIKEFVRKKK